MLPYLVFLRATLPYLGKEIERSERESVSSLSSLKIILRQYGMVYSLIFVMCTPEKKVCPGFAYIDIFTMSPADRTKLFSYLTTNNIFGIHLPKRL